MSKWKALAAQRGLHTVCPWCHRFVQTEIPEGTILTGCNDCRGGDVKTAGTDEPAFKSIGGPENEPWPKKGSPEYREFVQEQEEQRMMKAPESIHQHLLYLKGLGLID